MPPILTIWSEWPIEKETCSSYSERSNRWNENCVGFNIYEPPPNVFKQIWSENLDKFNVELCYFTCNWFFSCIVGLHSSDSDGKFETQQDPLLAQKLNEVLQKADVSD